MTITKIKLIGAALFLASSTAFSQPNYYAVSGIPDASSLVMRAWPSVKSKPINNIPHNAVKIEITGKHIFKEDKKWLQIMYQNSVGWVEADYLTEMQVFMPQPAMTAETQTNEAVNTTAFSYMQQTAAAPQPVPEGIPWTPEQDTIYHDPSQPLAEINLVERVETTHSLVVINSNQDQGDFKGENTTTGNRYGSIQATMSVVYQP